MVLLDVVYNHFGPEGNYLGRYAPAFFTERAHAVGRGDRLSRAGGARLRHRECAALAASTIVSTGCGSMRSTPSSSRASRIVLHELSRAVGDLASETGRHIHLVLENDDNRASLLDPRSDPPGGKYRAQWNDDYHHAWHVLLTRRKATAITATITKTRAPTSRAIFSSGFAYQGEASPHRGGRRRGEPSRRLPPTAFVNFLQNHDQIGNRALRRPADNAGGDAALAGGARHNPARPDAAAAVHGRGMGLAKAVSLLLRFPRRSCRGRAQRPARGVQGGLCASWAMTFPIRWRRDFPFGRARLGRARDAARHGSGWHSRAGCSQRGRRKSRRGSRNAAFASARWRAGCADRSLAARAVDQS